MELCFGISVETLFMSHLHFVKHFSITWFIDFFISHRREIETLETLRDSLQLEIDNSSDILKQREKDIQTQALKVSVYRY